MTGGFLSAALVAPLMLAAAGGFVFWFTAWQDRHDAAKR
jgi:hypothetical protein